MIGTDFDGTLNAGLDIQPPYAIISGRTFDEYDKEIASHASKTPTYIRGVGEPTDMEHIADFKSVMIKLLGITKFYENNSAEADIIKKQCPDCDVVLYGGKDESN